MTLANRLAQPSRKHVCRFEEVLESVPDEADKEALLSAVHDRRFPLRQVEQAVRDTLGQTLSEKSIRRHREGRCYCPYQLEVT